MCMYLEGRDSETVRTLYLNVLAQSLDPSGEDPSRRSRQQQQQAKRPTSWPTCEQGDDDVVRGESPALLHSAVWDPAMPAAAAGDGCGRTPVAGSKWRAPEGSSKRMTRGASASTKTPRCAPSGPAPHAAIRTGIGAVATSSAATLSSVSRESRARLESAQQRGAVSLLAL